MVCEIFRKRLLSKDFYQALREHHFEEKQGKCGRYCAGIRLKNPGELAGFEKELESGDVRCPVPLSLSGDR